MPGVSLRFEALNLLTSQGNLHAGLWQQPSYNIWREYFVGIRARI